MITIKVQGVDEFRKMLGDLQHKMPSALARGMTEAAKDAKQQITGWLPRLIDRPTPWTMRGLFIIPAEKKDLRAAVGFKQYAGRVGGVDRNDAFSVKAARSMRMQVYGGRRKQKRTEETMVRGHLMLHNQFMIPGPGAQRDRYGNVTTAFMNKVLYSGVKLGSASAPYHLPMQGRGSKESTRKGQYFLMRKHFGQHPVGIFKNMGKHAKPMPVFWFSNKADYKQRLPFDRIVNAQIDRSLRKRILESIDVITNKYR